MIYFLRHFIQLVEDKPVATMSVAMSIATMSVAMSIAAVSVAYLSLPCWWKIETYLTITGEWGSISRHCIYQGYHYRVCFTVSIGYFILLTSLKVPFAGAPLIFDNLFFLYCLFYLFFICYLLLPLSFYIYIKIQLNAAIAHFQGLVKIMLYIEVFIIANVWITMKMLLGTKICMLYWRNYVKSGCAIAGLYCTSKFIYSQRKVFREYFASILQVFRKYFTSISR